MQPLQHARRPLDRPLPAAGVLFLPLVAALVAGCGAAPHGGVSGFAADLAQGPSGGDDLASSPVDGSTPLDDLANANPGTDDGPINNQSGCGGAQDCYTVYAHGDHVLYRVDLPNKMLVTVGAFKAPMVNGSEDVITDLAVAPDDTIYVISKTNLYTADAKDGHVTVVTSLAACGTSAVALTFTPDHNLYAADFKGAFCHIDPVAKMVTTVGQLGGGLAIAGDIVAVSDGTVFGTAYKIADGSMGSALDNLLVKIDPKTGMATQTVGATGFPKMFGVAFANGQVFGFTHDGTGSVATIDPMTGKGTLYSAFKDPMTGKGISFAGAGVNPKVPGKPTHL
jgi:hypothetical protein